MDEDEDFFFESDHLALRGNKDYKCMLRVILILESQKMMLVQDIENLAASQKAALENPQEFLDDLKNSAVEFPCSSYSIPELPAISWSKYGVDDNQVIEWKKSFVESDQEKTNNNILVRGRTFDQTKPETFNQLWTCEEQRRLEELLKEYPEEEIEMRRWVKIANALGNRTPKQVMSRVQKYFIKLHQAGLPVPGRVRKPFTTKVGGLGYRNRYTKVFQKRSTFFPAQDVPVFMDENPQELENEGSMEGNVIKQWTPLEMMTAIYERRRLEENSNTPLPVHTGISCIGCSCENIIGTRWTDGVGSDWCSDCLIEFQPITKLTPISSLNFKDEFTPP